ncbi:type II toxin-antitoxin system RatA family toxin [Zavarzinia sp. CC-PAN008]|uniref:type II toxin-antitoxin system RatA family toxin n=1 Tax=Zavarzinia sp. CC-PAN008 TaxID=3243332 RepID=UPI003F74A953
MPRHAEVRRLPYSAGQMFDLVADVGRYPEFLPWCVGARVTRREPRPGGNEVIHADLLIGFKAIRERFGSRVTLQRPDRIDTVFTQGPFKHLENRWLFKPDGSEACTIDFYVDFEFRNRILGALIGQFFDEAVRRMVHAFESRAHQLYGVSRPVQPRPA